MNGRPDALTMPGPNVARPQVDREWRSVLLILPVTILLIVAINWRTAESIVLIWYRSETFAHGFLIVPISLWLIWSKRREIARLVPTTDYLGLALLAGAGLLWLIAAAGQVQVVQQYALVMMIPSVVVALVGRKVATELAFPLGFLLLGVPVGEALIPPLMDWTAAFTVAALQMTGIPVYQEGTFFTIPSGSWSVVEGCSGLRYLIASITVGALYAYLCYQRSWKRILFVALSVIVPILANGLRAYMIVMIGHLSNMKLANGVDHLIYGWVFFGLVMLLLFWLGSFWRDPLSPDEGQRGSEAMVSDRIAEGANRTSNAARLRFAFFAVAIAAAWPLYASYLDRAEVARPPATISLPDSVGGWVADKRPVTDWRPHFDPASATLFQTYRKGRLAAGVQITYYRHQQQGGQLISTTNVMVVQKHPVWSNVGESVRQEDIGQQRIEMRQTKLRSADQRLLIWDWYRIGNHYLSSSYRAKLLFAWNKLLGRGDAGTSILLVAPYDDSDSSAQATLQDFGREILLAMPSTLASVDDGNH